MKVSPAANVRHVTFSLARSAGRALMAAVSAAAAKAAAAAAAKAKPGSIA